MRCLFSRRSCDAARLELDPDESVQKAVKLVFERFSVEPSARAVLRWAQRTSFLTPTWDRATSELHWRPLGNVRLNLMLRNPTYAGVHVFGRRIARINAPPVCQRPARSSSGALGSARR
jgi:hypothetical protein